MSEKTGKRGRPARPSGPRDLVTTKVPRRRARQAAAIAKMTGRTVDEVWEAVAGTGLDAEFARCVKAEA